MLTKSLELKPEFIIILTRGTVKIRTNPAPKIVSVESFIAEPKSFILILCKKNVIIQTIIKIPPGKYNTWKLAFI